MVWRRKALVRELAAAAGLADGGGFPPDGWLGWGGCGGVDMGGVQALRHGSGLGGAEEGCGE